MHRFVSRSWKHVGFSGPLALAAATIVAGTSAPALGAGTITISGTVADAQLPQAGIIITLSGSAQGQVTTDFSGTYSFTVAAGGSYSLTAQGSPNAFTPPFHSCLAITPSIVNLNDLTASTVVNFVGTGTSFITNCAPAEVMGATSGSLTLNGVVTSGGQPVPGVLVSLAGNTQGFRITDETGAYSFSVNPGSYSIQPTGNTCATYSPDVVNLNNTRANKTQNFTATGCPPPPLDLCPVFDAVFGLTEPASCDHISSVACAGDRVNTYTFEMALDWANINATDCRFGKWYVPPVSNLLGVVDQLEVFDYIPLYILQLLGCAEAGNLDGPLPFPMILPDLVNQPFTTADLAALSAEFVEAISQGFLDFGLPPPTASESAAISAQLASAASRVPNVKNSSTLTYSTCSP